MSHAQTRLTLLGLVAIVMGAGCASEEIDKGGSGQGIIRGEISYEGATVITRVAIAVFDRGDNPPVTPPIEMFYDPQEPLTAGIAFPVDYEMSGLTEGEVWIMAYGDVDPEDGPLPKAIDPASEWFGPYTIAGTADDISLDMELADERWAGIDQDTVSSYFDGTDEEVVGGDDTGSEAIGDVTPAPGKAAIYGSIAYSGDKSGKLSIVGFPSDPPAGPPGIYYGVADEVSSFPMDYAYDAVKPGTHFVYAFIDVDPADGLKNTDLDPVSEITELTIKAGDVRALDFTLELP